MSSGKGSPCQEGTKTFPTRRFDSHGTPTDSKNRGESRRIAKTRGESSARGVGKFVDAMRHTLQHTNARVHPEVRRMSDERDKLQRPWSCGGSQARASDLERDPSPSGGVQIFRRARPADRKKGRCLSPRDGKMG